MTAERWGILGDSLQALVYGPGSVPGDQSRLTAAQLPTKLNLSINNLSSPGARMTDGGQPGFGAASNKNAITMMRGYAPMKGISSRSEPTTGPIPVHPPSPFWIRTAG